MVVGVPFYSSFVTDQAVHQYLGLFVFSGFSNSVIGLILWKCCFLRIFDVELKRWYGNVILKKHLLVYTYKF